MTKDDTTLRSPTATARIAPDVDFCSVVGERGRNEDYVLIEKGAGMCVADGIGGAPLGDAVARYACHAAMRALKNGEPATSAVIEAQNQVTRFIADVASPGSGASLMVVRFDDHRLDASWAGDTAIFVLRRNDDSLEHDPRAHEPRALDSHHHDPCGFISSLDPDRFDVVPPLGRSNGERVGAMSEDVEGIRVIAICTNGAWRTAGPEEIAKLLAEGDTARRTAARIVLGRRSRDDSTALVAKFHADGQGRGNAAECRQSSTDA